MGLFSFFSKYFFAKYSEKEKALLAKHSQMLIMMDVGPQEAERQAEELLDAAIEKSKKEGTYILPEKIGDMILLGYEQEIFEISRIYNSFILEGDGPQEAAMRAKKIMNETIEDLRKIFFDDTPSVIMPKSGEFIDCFVLGPMTNNPAINSFLENIRKKLPKILKEGVREEDFKWWWNLNDVERNMMIIDDDISKYQAYCFEIEKSNKLMEENPTEAAAKKVRKSFPIYGNPYGKPDDTTQETGDDRPLAIELKNRINIYIEKRSKENPEQLRRDLEQSSTFNALIRKEIRAGVL